MQKENYESFWLLNTHHQYQYECESSKFVLLFIQSAQNCDFQLQTEIRIIELLSCIYMRLTTHPTLKSLELFEVKVEILRFLAVKLILVLEGNGELSCILPFSKEFGRQPKGIKGEYTHIFTQALVASYKELISK